MKQIQSSLYFLMLAITVLFTWSSCRDKEPIDEPFACEEELGVFQSGPPAENYIKGSIDGRPFYYGDANSNFIKYAVIANESNGGGNPQTSFTFGFVDTLFLRYGYLPKINRPIFNFLFNIYTNKNLETISYYDTLFQPGAIRVSKSPTPVEDNNIGIIMYVSCDNNQYTIWKSVVGAQPQSYFNIKSVNRKENDEAVTWTIVAGFDMNIYKDVFGEKLWKRIEDGEIKMDITVKK